MGRGMIGANKCVAELVRQASATKIALAVYGKGVMAPQMEAWAKANAPWSDISGNARRGLKGGAVVRGNHVVIYIAHTVDYGVYLELSNDKNYEILDPTIDHFKDQILKGYQKIMAMKV